MIGDTVYYRNNGQWQSASGRHCSDCAAMSYFLRAFLEAYLQPLSSLIIHLVQNLVSKCNFSSYLQHYIAKEPESLTLRKKLATHLNTIFINWEFLVSISATFLLFY